MVADHGSILHMQDIHAVLVQIKTYPDTVYLLDVSIVGMDKLPSFLGRDIPASIVYAPVDDRISSIFFPLCFHVDDDFAEAGFFQ